MFSPTNLTDQQLIEDELNVCKLGLKFIPTVNGYDRVKKWMDIKAFKRKVGLHYFHNLESSDSSISSEGFQNHGNVNQNLTLQKLINSI